jgi:hypothetical protein
MIPDRDYYVDKNGKLTDDPSQYARQVGVKGFFLDEGTARRFGITDTLVSVDEPAAPRRVTDRNEASVKIVKAEEKEDKPQEPQEPAAVAEKPVKAAKPAAKKGEKKK